MGQQQSRSAALKRRRCVSIRLFIRGGVEWEGMSARQGKGGGMCGSLHKIQDLTIALVGIHMKCWLAFGVGHQLPSAQNGEHVASKRYNAVHLGISSSRYKNPEVCSRWSHRIKQHSMSHNSRQVTRVETTKPELASLSNHERRRLSLLLPIAVEAGHFLICVILCCIDVTTTKIQRTLTQ